MKNSEDSEQLDDIYSLRISTFSRLIRKTSCIVIKRRAVISVPYNVNSVGALFIALL